jgi:hypothetical protein
MNFLPTNDPMPSVKLNEQNSRGSPEKQPDNPPEAITSPK